jgi:arylsulfatase B
MNDYWTQQTTSGGTACNWLDPSIVDLWESGAPARSLNGTKYIEYLFADRMSSIIANHNVSDPLFIYYAPHTVHYPLEVPEEWYNKYSFVENDEQGCNYTTPMIFPGSLPSQYSCRRQANAMVCA